MLRSARRLASIGIAFGSVLSAAACATGGAGGTSAPAPASSTAPAPARPVQRWPVKTREHVDLWLHGFALLQNDSGAVVPLFKRGYATDMTVLKNKGNVLTQLDANRDRLQSGLKESQLINAQFVPFYFNSVDEMHSVIDRFVATNGSQQGARTQQEAAQFAVLASYFQSPADRAWLSLFASSLWDEDAKFFHSYWTRQQAERAPVIDSVQAMWQHTVQPAIARYLTNTQQRDGDLLLSLPLGGEGRTIGGSATSRAAVAVDFPERQGDAPEAIYTVMHEIVGSIAASAINDNTTPAEKRNGTADRLTSAAQVRGGLMLLEKQLPQLADGYARYYITQSGRTPTASPRTQLVQLFPLPDTIRDAMSRQIDLIQGGI